MAETKEKSYGNGTTDPGEGKSGPAGKYKRSKKGKEERSLKVLPMQAFQTAASVLAHRLLHSATFGKVAFAYIHGFCLSEV